MVVAAEPEAAQLAELTAAPWPVVAVLDLRAPRLRVQSHQLAAASSGARAVALVSAEVRLVAAYQHSCWRTLTVVRLVTPHAFVVGAGAFLGCCKLERATLRGCLALGNLCFANCRRLAVLKVSPPMGATLIVGRGCLLNTAVATPCIESH